MRKKIHYPDPIFLKIGILMFIFIFMMTGCFLIRSKQDINKSMESTIVIGQIFIDVPIEGPVIVAACSANENRTIAHYTVLHEAGEYELAVDQGNYYVFAFIDKNSNLVYDKGEPCGQHGDPKLVSVPPVGVVFDIDVVIQEQCENKVITPGMEISAVKPPKLYSRQAGAIVQLDDELFAEENGKKGFWEPVTFFKQFGGNIYFLEPYNPEKTPVLFIHGASGTPKNFIEIMKNMDRTRFQPWFFYYPSGSRLNSMSYLLLWKLSTLQAKYQFKKIYFTAHSMGGLIAKSFIVNSGQKFPNVGLFISLATPWGGDSMAEYGVEQSPLVIPSWIDMQPKSDFIKSLYTVKLPETTKFYIFYGYKGSSLPFQSNNDGTIDLSSLLDDRPQSEATMVYAFNEDHASILFSQKAIDRYNTILNEFDHKQNESDGYLKVQFDYTYDIEGINPNPKLLLHPIGEEIAETVSYLNADDSGRILGPFSAGDYIANMVDPGWKTEKINIPVRIDSNKTSELDFSLLPDGMIFGCVTASLQPEDQSLGMPDYQYKSADTNLKIRSITLEGNGLHRELEQIEGEEVYNDNYLIVREDICYNTCFVFFGLPAGEYKLILEAEGYKPLIQNYTVVQGIPSYFRITELVPQ